jgi:predicted GIY-YIG superfamily endonuclease
MFPHEKPLVDRLGARFFAEIPTGPGVYYMRNDKGDVLYVGKAKNLRKRLQSYRVANPDRMHRRHLRLVRHVARIDFDICQSESEALTCEAGSILRLKPRFNRAGVWPGSPRFLIWRFVDESAQFSVAETPLIGWERFGPLGAYAPRIHGTLVRLLWLALHPEAGFSRLPLGWIRHQLPLPITLSYTNGIAEARLAVDHLFWGRPEEFRKWLDASINPSLGTFDRAALQNDLDEIESFIKAHRADDIRCHQLALL